MTARPEALRRRLVLSAPQREMRASASPFQRSDGGLAAILGGAALHEIYAAAGADAPAAAAFALLAGLSQSPRLIWARQVLLDLELGCPAPHGLAELGLDPSAVVLVRARDAAEALQAGFDAARRRIAQTVLIEMIGPARAYDLTASRRLVFAAQKTGVGVFIARSDALPAPSAATTRWRVRAAISQSQAANAPGAPSFALELLRRRNGREGLNLLVEWSREARSFVLREHLVGSGKRGDACTSLSGPLVSVSADGTSNVDGYIPDRRAG